MTQESNASRSIIIEQHKRFSESCLWKMQRDYFDQEGIHAWVNQVPFYITSNPFIANAYAKVATAFIRDVMTSNPAAKKQPFYILELGTGSGRFSYYAVKAILDRLAALNMHDIQICYVMSDFTKNNIQYYETHPALQPFVTSGQIDFAIFDLESEKPITLLNKNIHLSPEILVNPLIVFANYIFDTVSHDSFTITNGQLHELLLSVSTTEDNLKDHKPINMEMLSIDHELREIHNTYYNDKVCDAILDEYRNTLLETSFLFPIGSIKAIRYLKKLAHDNILIIASDKGYNSLTALDRLGHPSLSFHGSFSMMVNFHALAEYFKKSGGDAFLQTSRKGIKTSVFSSRYQLADCKNTTLAIQEHLEGFSPADYFTLHRRMSDSFEGSTLDVLAAHLNLSQWDPHIFSKIANFMNSQVAEADGDTISYLAENVPKLAANYYYMPKSDCVLFEVAVFYHSIKHYQTAIDYYKEAERYVGEQFGLYYNMALCEHNIGLNEQAMENFVKARSLEPQSKEASDWIEYLGKIEGGEL